MKYKMLSELVRAGVYKLLTSGELGYFKLGKTYKIPKDALIAYMNRKAGKVKRREVQK